MTAEDPGLVVGVGVGPRSASVAIAAGGRLAGVCYQERVTRVRGAGVAPGQLPNEALDLMLQRLGRTRASIGRTIVAGGAEEGSAALDHHHALAATAFLTSPHDQALVVVCDHHAPFTSVWRGQGLDLTPADPAWGVSGFTHALHEFARLLGFGGDAALQRFEALARLAPAARDASLDALIRLERGHVVVDGGLGATVTRLLPAGDDVPRRAAVAGALQARLGDVLLEWLGRLASSSGAPAICLGGNLFYNSAMNTRVRLAGAFAHVFVPVDPGTAGRAVGAALLGSPTRVPPPTPFLGPDYSAQDVKAVLDNCKLQYEWSSEEGVVTEVVRALKAGHLVGWFQGAMEWGPRAVGARCILASPTAPYVLENLNRFLKRREPWRGYALSGTAAALAEHFEGPAEAPFMECDYRPRNPASFAHVLPVSTAAVRVHTVNAQTPYRFARLVQAFGEATGMPFLVNTSFNGFHEPIVCDPRDAVRVFYGSGLDLLVMEQFILRK